MTRILLAAMPSQPQGLGELVPALAGRFGELVETGEPAGGAWDAATGTRCELEKGDARP